MGTRGWQLPWSTSVRFGSLVTLALIASSALLVGGRPWNRDGTGDPETSVQRVIASPLPTPMIAPSPAPTVARPVRPVVARAPAVQATLVTGTPGAVALTFDDGPHPTYTPQILDILDRYGAKATFFVIGGAASRYPDLVRDMTRRGHVVANHTWRHVRLTGLSDQRFAEEVDTTSELIADLTGSRPRCLRPPGGHHDAVVRARLHDREMELAMWTVDSRDWQRPGTGRIHSKVVSGLTSGAIVVLHDGGGNREQTVAALPGIIEAGREGGMTFSAICHPAPSESEPAPQMPPPAEPSPAPTAPPPAPPSAPPTAPPTPTPGPLDWLN